MIALLATLPPGLFSGDEGVKLIQTISLQHHGLTSDALIYPGERFDPDWRYFPLPSPFVIGYGHDRHSIYATLFAALGLPGWILGRSYVGALFLPALGAVTTTLLVVHFARLAGRRPLGSALMGLAVLALSPLAAYGATYTEHTVAVALLLVAFCCLARPTPRTTHAIVAGVALGASAMMRPEVLAMALAFAVFVVLTRGLDRPTLKLVALIAVAAAGCYATYVVRNLLVLGVWNPAVYANL